MPTTPRPSAALFRTAVAFWLNGVASSIWIVRTPRLAERLGSSAGALGLVFALMAVGGVAGSRIAPRLLRGRPPSRAMLGSGFLLAGAMLLRGVPHGLAGFCAVQLVGGIADGLHDVSMNAEGVRLDVGLGRSIMNRLHGIWSLGALCGAAFGSGLAASGLSFGVHTTIAGIGLLVLNLTVLGAWREPYAPLAVVDAAAHGERRWTGLVVLLCAVGVAVALAEAAPVEWGSIYLRDRLGTSEGAAGLTGVAFAAAMLLGRLLGDHAVERRGAMNVLRSGAIVYVVGMVVALAVDRPWAVIAGWAAAGLGVSTAFPALFVASAKLPGVAAEDGMGAVISVTRLGFLVGPLAIGATVNAGGVRTAMLIPLVAAVSMAIGASYLAPRARIKRAAP